MGRCGRSLSSVSAVLERVASARDVAFGAYFLPHGAMRDALAGGCAPRRARRGDAASGSVPESVREALQRRSRARAARRRCDRHAACRAIACRFTSKRRVCDGVAYLDDRNWTQRGPETVVGDDDPADVALVRDALAGRGGTGATLATRKDEALRARSRPDRPGAVRRQWSSRPNASRPRRSRARCSATRSQERRRRSWSGARAGIRCAKRGRFARSPIPALTVRAERTERKARPRRRHRLDRFRECDRRLGPGRRSTRMGDAHARTRARCGGSLGARA